MTNNTIEQAASKFLQEEIEKAELNSRHMIGVDGAFIAGAEYVMNDVEKLIEIARDAISLINCSDSCSSNNGGWLSKCNCGAEKKHKELKKALAEWRGKYNV